MAILTKSFRRQVCYLLGKSHIPRVAVRSSQVEGAGNGVFYEVAEKRNHPEDIDDGIGSKVLCLYPGIYTPPLPPPLFAGILSCHEDNNEIMETYLAKRIPPSQVDLEDNAYILNLETIGGYLDGLALHSASGRSLDSSPSACGHLINHYRPSQNKPNVAIVPFLWNEVLQPAGTGDFDAGVMDRLPNAMRCDGSPWYLDTITETIIHFPKEEGETTNAIHPFLAGAAVISMDHDLSDGQELFLDYGLRMDKLPRWAKDWYQA
jgi:hypothetical protein